MTTEGNENGQDNGVGVLGWLGFIIINFAAWGIIGVSSAIAWPVGFLFCLVYDGLLMGLAILLERRWGAKYKSFENILWVLACVFLFVLGMYLTINVVGPAAGETPENPWNGGNFGSVDNDLKKQLPGGASVELRAWAEDNYADYRIVNVPTFANFQGFVFFRGMAETYFGDKWSDSTLLRADDTTTVQVTPALYRPENFNVFKNALYFVENDKAIWVISESNAKKAAPEAKGFFGIEAHSGASNLMVDYLKVIDGIMYWKGAYNCNNGHYVKSAFKTNGTIEGTTILRGNDGMTPKERWCPDGSGEQSGTFTNDDNNKKPQAQLWGALFLAILPMMALAAFILWKKKLPGMFLNLFIGGGMVVVDLYVIGLSDSDQDKVPTFMKWFVLFYSAAVMVATSVVSIVVRPLPAVLDSMKDWIVVAAGAPFFFMIHIVLEIPVTDGAGFWVIYALVAGVLMLMSIAIGRTFPMILGAIATFVIAYKISLELARGIFGDVSGEGPFLFVLAILALQGIGIIILAIYYSSKREEIDAAVKESLLKCCRRSRSRLPSEENKDAAEVDM